MELFIEHNSKTLKYCIFVFWSSEEFIDNAIEYAEHFKHLLSVIPKLENLVHLKIVSFPINDTPFETQFKEIALNCSQLKSLIFVYEFDLLYITSIDELMAPLRQFGRLKRLEIYLVDDFTPEEIEMFSFKAFKGFEELTHLLLYFIHDLSADEKILTDIDIHLPKLQSLILYGICVKPTEWTADILSRLSALETIEMTVNDKSIDLMIPQIKSKLIEKCKRIRKISVYLKQ